MKTRKNFIYLKYGCLALSCVLLLSLFFMSDFSGKAMDILDQRLSNSAKKICYQGHDAKGQPFTICAHEGIEISAQQILFKQIEIVLCLKTTHQLQLTADEGLYNKDDKKMTMTGQVRLTHSNGLQLHTSEAHVDLKKSTAENTVPVEGKGQKFSLKSVGFRVLEAGKRILFLGNPQFRVHG
jgi:LPS export ABC transporter protein LptC